MYGKFGLLSGGAAIALLTAFGAAPALAQSAPPASQAAAAGAPTGELTEVVVTAQRRSENAQTTPVTVSAFSSTNLAARRIDKVQDLKNSVPNLVIDYGTASPSTIQAYMRGAGVNGANVAAESAVGIYIDDIYYARLSGLNLDFADLKDLEVLRGPQGTLYGRNTLTGAIKFDRLTPTGQTFGSVEASYGSYNELRLRGVYSAPLNDDWAFLAQVNGSRMDGYTHDLYNNTTRGDRSQYGGRLALGYTGQGPFKANFSVEYNRDQNQGDMWTAFNTTTLKPLYGYRTYISPVVPYGKDGQFVADAHMSYDLGPVTLKSITGLVDGTDEFAFDVFGGQVTPAGFASAYKLYSSSHELEVSQELQAVGHAFNGKLDYLTGFYFFYEQPHQIEQVNLLGTQYLPSREALSTTSYAVFGQATYHVTDALSLTVGLRDTIDHKTVDESLQNGTTIKPPTLAFVEASDTFDSLTPKFGLDYKFTPNIFGYLSVSKGFQAGGFNAGALASPASVVQPYGPESVWTYEAGVKSELFDRRLRVNLDYFLNNFDNLQLSALNPVTGAITTQNAGSATVNGPELEVNYTPIKGLVFFANGAYTFGYYDTVLPTSQVATSHASVIPYVSKFQGQFGFDEKLPLDELGVPGDKGYLTFGADISYRSQYNVTATQAPISEMGPYSVTNAYVGWQSQDQHLNLTLSGKNIFNREYYFSGANLGAIGERAPALPQMFRFDVRYSF
jgi:iron complex outermembrane receptor protein